MAVHLCAVVAASLPLAWAAMTGVPAAGITPLALFIALQGVGYYFGVARRRLDLNLVGRYGRAIFRWTVGAHVAWIGAMFFLGECNAIPHLLPVVTGALQLAIALALPVGFWLLRGRLAVEDLIYDREQRILPRFQAEFVPGAAAGRRTAWIISFQGVSNEPRVIRQSRALLDDGWRVVVCGFDGHSPRPPEWTYIRLPQFAPFYRVILRALQALRIGGQLLASIGKLSAVRRPAALLAQACNPMWLYIRRSLLAEARQHPDLRPDLVIAHDYYTADIAYALARRSGAKFSLDCHEYAAQQNADDPGWVRWRRPTIVAVEDYYLRRADVVTTVCDGIAELLDREHRLKRPVVVVRNVPLDNPQPYREPGERLKVLYHGDLSRPRQLHVAIRSMPRWRPEFDLVLRGNGDPAYIAELHALVAEMGLAERVFFEPAVPFDEIVPAANMADIGFYSYLNYSPQIDFSLPNKFFEYVMAGLAVCVGNFAEVRRLVERHGLGKLIPEHTPEAIAATINSFTREEIRQYKKASIEAAKTLNWDAEKQRLVEAYDGLFPDVAAQAEAAPGLRIAGAAVADGSSAQ